MRRCYAERALSGRAPAGSAQRRAARSPCCSGHSCSAIQLARRMPERSSHGTADAAGIMISLRPWCFFACISSRLLPYSASALHDTAAITQQAASVGVCITIWAHALGRLHEKYERVQLHAGRPSTCPKPQPEGHTQRKNNFECKLCRPHSRLTGAFVACWELCRPLHGVRKADSLINTCSPIPCWGRWRCHLHLCR